MAAVDNLIIDLAGGETKTKSSRRSAAGLAGDLFNHLRPTRRDSVRNKTATSVSIEKALASTEAEVEKEVDSSKLLLFAHDKSQGRSILSDDYAKLLAMCFNSGTADVSCPTDQEKGWISWAEKWFSRFCAQDNKCTTEIQIAEGTGLPQFEWFSEYASVGTDEAAQKLLSAISPSKKCKSVTLIHSGTAMDSLEVFDDQRSSNANCGLIVRQLCQTKQIFDAGDAIKPTFVLLNIKNHYSLLSTLDGITWNHHDSSKDSANEDHARLWVRRTRQLCTLWLNREELASFPKAFTFVAAQDRAKLIDSESSLCPEWTHDEPHSSLLVCLMQVSLFLASKFSTWPLLPLRVEDESVLQLLQTLRQQCRYFFTFLTWFQHLKLKNEGFLAPKAAATTVGPRRASNAASASPEKGAK